MAEFFSVCTREKMNALNECIGGNRQLAASSNFNEGTIIANTELYQLDGVICRVTLLHGTCWCFEIAFYQVKLTHWRTH